MFAYGINGGCLLKLLILIDTFFNEDLLQRLEMQLFQELVLADFEFLADQVFRAVYAVAQHIADGQKLRFIVFYDAAVGRDIDFTVCEGIEGIDRFVRRDARCQMYLDLNIGCREVFYLTCLDLTLFDGFDDRVL